MIIPLNIKNIVIFKNTAGKLVYGHIKLDLLLVKDWQYSICYYRFLQHSTVKKGEIGQQRKQLLRHSFMLDLSSFIYSLYRKGKIIMVATKH